MAPGPTPERVYALAKYLEAREKSREELFQDICMVEVQGDGSKDIYDQSILVAQELGLIRLVDGRFKLSVDAEVLSTHESFRRYVANETLVGEDSLFFQTVSFYLKRVDDFITCEDRDAVLQLFIQNQISLNHNDLLGWRFWASFIGIIYLHESHFIPNTYVRIHDVLINQTNFAKREAVPVVRFFVWLESRCPEFKESRRDTIIGLAVATGLQTLEDLGEIELISQPDATKWQLDLFDSKRKDVSHIRIMR